MTIETKTADHAGHGDVDLPGSAPATAIAFLAGAGVLALEITGARVFIPWFGSSVLVWSNVIGVTLAAVAVGNLIGGRLADRYPQRRVLGSLLAGAGLLTATVPFVVPSLAARYLPEGLKLETAYALIGRGSLVVALASMGPALLLLGAASPILVRGAAATAGIGRAAGRISGAGTLGSLIGTWAPVYWLIPTFGSRATLLIAGALLVGAAAIAMARLRRHASVLAVAAALLFGGGVLADRAVGRAGHGAQILAESESRYQYLRVERTAEGQVALRLNEGLDSFHSVTTPGEVLTGAYFDYYSLYLPPPSTSGPPEAGPSFADPSEAGPRKVLILGFAAGTIARQLLQIYGGGDGPARVEITGVELDPAVAALGHPFFELPQSPDLRVITDQDARTFLRVTAERFDLIVIDTFADQVYVPFQMCSEEVFLRCREVLRDGGVLAANLSGFSIADLPVAAIINTAASAFGAVSTLTVRGGRNFVLAASKDGPPDPRDMHHPTPLASVLAAAQEPGAFQIHRFSPSATILTDDLSPIEVLSDRDLRSRATKMIDAAAKVDHG